MQNSPLILLVDDEPVILDSVGRILSKAEYRYESVSSGMECLKLLETKQYDVILLDLSLPDIPGQQVLEKIKEVSPGTLVVIITGNATLDNAIQTLKMGAADFLAKPFSPTELRALLAKLSRELNLVRENEFLRRRINVLGEEQEIIGQSDTIQDVLALVDKIAPTDSTILILGESGTGKEIIARAIHEKSRRTDKEFVPIDCTSLVETLLESELFGHVRGSFTGALETKHGYFELAGAGTMFFDEVGNLPLSIQAKLLRVLQTRQFSPVGSTRTITADVRVLAATNQNLEQLIATGQFREDLFYRINVVPIHLPPLRERIEDVPLLVQYFIERFNRRRVEPISSISPEAMAALKAYHWPGNIRELENTIERGLILQDGDTLTLKNLPIRMASNEEVYIETLPLSLEEMEKRHILHVLELVKGNRSKAAEMLGIDRKTLYNKIRKFEVKTNG